MIPKLLQLHWFWDEWPAYGDANVSEWAEMLPDWEIRVYREVPRGLPAAVTSRMAALPDGRRRADPVRYFTLWRDGGVYVDLDTRPLRRFDELLACRAFYPLATLSGGPPFPTICCLGGEPGHDFFRRCLMRCASAARCERNEAACGSKNILRHPCPDATVTVLPVGQVVFRDPLCDPRSADHWRGVRDPLPESGPGGPILVHYMATSAAGTGGAA